MSMPRPSHAARLLRPLAPTALALGIVVAIVGLTGCDRPSDNRTVGQKVDAAIDTVQQKSGQAATEARKEVDSARVAVGETVDLAADKVKDLAITTSVNAELARDPALSARQIDVDTDGGRVLLHGTAPNIAARERATSLALRVEGVVSVDNELLVSN
jgi:osmotically-inducible protein OsmY